MINKAGFTLIELIITIAIIAILAAIAYPVYTGYISNARQAEAKSNLQSLRLLEEQRYAENAAYTASIGTCAADNNPNIALIQAVLPGFQPGSGLNFSYCIEQNIRLDGTAQTPCFRASAFGNTGTSVAGDTFRIDCNNNRNF
ncbi:MAG: prepilin-type N-terminal cleavage/methylation domain-containing protein [Nitrospirae bacterium]|nr:prepilin-type N-terminal cleavage/methylation domain-containing protein [Nitrospirota bacterium]